MKSPAGRFTRWEGDQKTGFFGYTPRRRSDSGSVISEQPLHKHRVDIDQAFAEVGDIFDLWALSRHAPNAPALSGGALDTWPQVLLQGFGVCQQEEAAVRAFEVSQSLKSEVSGG